MTSLAGLAVAATLAAVSFVAAAPSFAGNSRSSYSYNSDGSRVRAPYTRVYTGGAVRVRAPTTRVAVDPGYWGGGVRIRAPYTNIDIGW